MAGKEIAEYFRFDEPTYSSGAKKKLTPEQKQEIKRNEFYKTARSEMAEFYKEFKKTPNCLKYGCNESDLCSKINKVGDFFSNFGTLAITRDLYHRNKYKTNRELYHKQIKFVFDSLIEILEKTNYDNKIRKVTIAVRDLYDSETGVREIVPLGKREEKKKSSLEKIANCKKNIPKPEPLPNLKPQTKLERIIPKQEPVPETEQKKPYEKPAIIEETALAEKNQLDDAQTEEKLLGTATALTYVPNEPASSEIDLIEEERAKNPDSSEEPISPDEDGLNWY